MKLIDKYLLRSFFVPLIYCLLAFTIVIVVFDLFDNLPDFIEGKTPLPDVLRFYAFLMPSMGIIIVPVSLFLACLYSLSHLTKNNELTAMRACGVSLYRLMMPFVVLGVIASLLVSFVHETLAPWSSYWTDQFVHLQRSHGQLSVYVARMLGFVNEAAGRDWIVDEFDTRTFEMSNATVTQQAADGTSERIQARKAYWMDGRWWFVELIIQKFDRDSNPMGPPKFQAHREMVELTEVPEDFINEIKDPEFLSSVEILKFLKTHRNLSKDTIARVRVDLHNRLAMPWTCLIVMLIGIPFGAQTGRRGAFLGALLAIGLFFGFYVLINFAIALGKKEVIAPWLAGWTPNIFFLALGYILIHRMR